MDKIKGLTFVLWNPPLTVCVKSNLLSKTKMASSSQCSSVWRNESALLSCDLSIFSQVRWPWSDTNDIIGDINDIINDIISLHWASQFELSNQMSLYKWLRPIVLHIIFQLTSTSTVSTCFPVFWIKWRLRRDFILVSEDNIARFTEENRRRKNLMGVYGIFFYLWEIRLTDLLRSIISTCRNHRKKIWRKNSKYSTTRSAGNILLAVLPFYFLVTYSAFPFITTLLLTPSYGIHQLYSILQKVNCKRITYSEHLRHSTILH